MSISMSLLDTGGTGDYTSLTTWESTEQANLTVGDGCIKYVYCKASTGKTDGTPVTIDGWTTNQNSYIYIASTGSDKHAGLWDDTKYRLTHSMVDDHTIRINSSPSYSVIDGLQIKSTTNTSEQYRYGINIWSKSITIKNCIIKADKTNANYAGILCDASSTRPHKVYNNIVYGFIGSGGSGIGASSDRGGSLRSLVYNNTVANCNEGFHSAYDDTLIKNNIAYSCSLGYDADVWPETSTNNYYDPLYGGAPITIDGGFTCSLTLSGSITFMNALGNDYRLVFSDVGAKDKGANLSADAYCSFSVDIIGTNRGSAWDIGAFEYLAGPSSVSMSLVDTGGTGNYTSLTTWESTEEADLTVGDGCQKWVYCKSSDGVADTARCRVLGWVMASGKGVVITSTGSDRHNGVWDDTKYRNVSITADLTSMVIYDTWVTIDGLQLWGSSSQALDFQTGATDSVGNPIVKNCILRGSNTLYINIVSAIGEPGQFYKIYNNIIYDAKGSENTGILISIATLATASVYNNTIINCNRGIRRTAGDAIVINNLITGSADGDVFIGTYDALSTNNSSNQTDNPGGTNYASQTFTFVDRDADNFCLAATDAGARDIGADLSANAFCSFSVDIIGTTRPYNTVWDIGAFEYTAGTPSVILPKVVFQGIGTARFRFR